MHGLKIKWHHYSPLIQDTFIDVMNVTINGEEKRSNKIPNTCRCPNCNKILQHYIHEGPVTEV